jgi:hypothetical protein
MGRAPRFAPWEENADMSKPKVYHVTFYRELVGDGGRRFDSVVDTIRVRRSRAKERAVSAAIKRFERRHKLAHWSHLASKFEITEIVVTGEFDENRHE